MPSCIPCGCRSSAYNDLVTGHGGPDFASLSRGKARAISDPPGHMMLAQCSAQVSLCEGWSAHRNLQHRLPQSLVLGCGQFDASSKESQLSRVKRRGY